MKLKCLVDHTYGAMPKLTNKVARELDLNPKVYHGGPVREFKAGEEVDVDQQLAVRLLRDYGPASGRTPDKVHFEPADPREYIEYLQTQSPMIPMSAVLAGALGQRPGEDGGREHEVDV